MLDLRKGIVVVMQQLTPTGVLRGAAEALGVGLQAVPPDEQQVSIGRLDAAPQLQTTEAGDPCGKLPRLREVPLEGRRQTRTTVEPRASRRSTGSPGSP